MTGEDLKLVLQSIGLALALLGAWRKWERERQSDRHEREQHRLEQAERLTRMETKVDILFNFWEQKMERRSARDEKAWLAKHAAEAGMIAAADKNGSEQV